MNITNTVNTSEECASILLPTSCISCLALKTCAVNMTDEVSNMNHVTTCSLSNQDLNTHTVNQWSVSGNFTGFSYLFVDMLINVRDLFTVSAQMT